MGHGARILGSTMSDASLQALRKRLERGDEEARGPLRRALARAGLPVLEAWAGLALTASPALAGAGPEVERALAELDPRALLELLRHAPDARLTDGLVARRAGNRVTLEPGSTARLDARRRRGRWRDDHATATHRLALELPDARALEVVRGLFARLGEPLGAGPPARADRAQEWTCGARRVRHVAAEPDDLWAGPGAEPARGEVDGLPGGVTLDLEDDGATWVVDGPVAAAARVERELLALLDALAAEVPFHACPVEPEAWAARARALPLRGREVEHERHERLVVGPVEGGVRWAALVTGRGLEDARRSAAGPLPVELASVRLRARRPAPATDEATAALARAVGLDLASAGVEAEAASTGARWLRRRLGPRVAISADLVALSGPAAGAFVERHLRVHDERGEGVALRARVRDGERGAVDALLVGPGQDVAVAAATLRALLAAGGWTLDER